MREIKFRAWFPDKQEMKLVAMQNVYEGNKTYLYLSPIPMSDYEPIELMQYTGLKDKNGKGIYEGDVVRLVDMPASPHQETTVSEVFFCNGGFYFKSPFSEEHMALQFITIPSPFANGYVPLECEVIGNIYENPELLKGTA